MRSHVRVAAITFVLVLALCAGPAHALFGGTLPVNECVYGKLGCVSKAKSCLLKCHTKALGKGLAVDPVCLTKRRDELGAPRLLRPIRRQRRRHGDRERRRRPGPVRWELDGISEHDGGPACPTRLSFLPTSKGPAYDPGWQGFLHDQRQIGGAKLTVATTCTGTHPSCSCTYTGPIANPDTP